MPLVNIKNSSSGNASQEAPYFVGCSEALSCTSKIVKSSTSWKYTYYNLATILEVHIAFDTGTPL